MNRDELKERADALEELERIESLNPDVASYELSWFDLESGDVCIGVERDACDIVQHIASEVFMPHILAALEEYKVRLREAAGIDADSN